MFPCLKLSKDTNNKKTFSLPDITTIAVHLRVAALMETQCFFFQKVTEHKLRFLCTKTQKVALNAALEQLLSVRLRYIKNQNNFNFLTLKLSLQVRSMLVLTTHLKVSEIQIQKDIFLEIFE